ncbi:MAG: hypothetical protein WC471_03530 [Candidatus Woesearchaeota archaeon]
MGKNELKRMSTKELIIYLLNKAPGKKLSSYALGQEIANLGLNQESFYSMNSALKELRDNFRVVEDEQGLLLLLSEGTSHNIQRTHASLMLTAIGPLHSAFQKLDEFIGKLRE